MYYSIIFACIILSLIAQNAVMSSFNKYAKVANSKGISGAQAAQELLNSKGIYDVDIVETRGSALSDAYDPSRKVIRLSAAVYQSTSISSVAVACHEASHAVQHAEGYKALAIRNKMLPFVAISNRVSWLIIFVGLLAASLNTVYFGIALFGLVAVFQLVTLPVEFNASARALNYLQSSVLVEEENQYAKKVLSAAAFTYVAALITSVAQIMNLLLLFGGGRRR